MGVDPRALYGAAHLYGDVNGPYLSKPNPEYFSTCKTSTHKYLFGAASMRSPVFLLLLQGNEQ